MVSVACRTVRSMVFVFCVTGRIIRGAESTRAVSGGGRPRRRGGHLVDAGSGTVRPGRGPRRSGVAGLLTGWATSPGRARSVPSLSSDLRDMGSEPSSRRMSSRVHRVAARMPPWQTPRGGVGAYLRPRCTARVRGRWVRSAEVDLARVRSVAVLPTGRCPRSEVGGPPLSSGVPDTQVAEHLAERSPLAERGHRAHRGEVGARGPPSRRPLCRPP